MSLKWMSNISKLVNYRTEVVVLEDGQQIVSWDKPYVRGMNMLFVALNGVEQQLGVYEEYTDFSIRFLEEDYLMEGDVVSIYYIPTSLSLGDIRVVGSSSSLNHILDAQYNEVAASVQDKKFYIFKGDRWEEFISSGGGGGSEEIFPHSINYFYDELDNIIQSITKVDNMAVSTSNYVYDEEGNISQEIILKDSKMITKTFEYDGRGNITNILVSVNN
jgi:hypothetical protein